MLSPAQFLGNDQTTEAENFDRYSLALPGAQQDLLEAVAAAQPNVVIVLQVMSRHTY